MDELNAIIIDDETAARNVLANLIAWSNKDVRIIGQASNLIDGIELIKRNKPDLVFLDVQMPDFAGYEIVNFFPNIQFEIIFVTAFDQYAIKAFEISAIDYLVKPIDRKRLNIALEKVEQRIKSKSEINHYHLLKESLDKKSADKIILSELKDGCVVQRIIYTDKVVAIEAQRAYAKIYFLDEEPLIVSKSLKSLESAISDKLNFVRSHRSWMINISCVKEYSASNGMVYLDNGIIAKLSKNHVPIIKSKLKLLN